MVISGKEFPERASQPWMQTEPLQLSEAQRNLDRFVAATHRSRILRGEHYSDPSRLRDTVSQIGGTVTDGGTHHGGMWRPHFAQRLERRVTGLEAGEVKAYELGTIGNITLEYADYGPYNPFAMPTGKVNYPKPEDDHTLSMRVTYPKDQEDMYRGNRAYALQLNNPDGTHTVIDLKEGDVLLFGGVIPGQGTSPERAGVYSRPVWMTEQTEEGPKNQVKMVKSIVVPGFPPLHTVMSVLPYGQIDIEAVTPDPSEQRRDNPFKVVLYARGQENKQK